MAGNRTDQSRQERVTQLKTAASQARASHSSRRSGRVPVIGITGSIGAGKSAVAEFFRKWGALVISGDAIGHEVVEISLTVRKRLTAEFGKDIIVRGKVRRDRLAASAFASPEALLALNRIVHPRLIRELNSRVARARRSERHKAVVIDAALLAEWGIGRIHWDYLVGVWAPLEIRRARLRIRGLTDTQFHQRARQQMPWSQRRKLVDCVVKNDSTLSVLQGRARLCWTNLLS